jgi:hypothetical protein
MEDNSKLNLSSLDQPALPMIKLDFKEESFLIRE